MSLNVVTIEENNINNNYTGFIIINCYVYVRGEKISWAPGASSPSNADVHSTLLVSAAVVWWGGLGCNVGGPTQGVARRGACNKLAGGCALLSDPSPGAFGGQGFQRCRVFSPTLARIGADKCKAGASGASSTSFAAGYRFTFFPSVSLDTRWEVSCSVSLAVRSRRCSRHAARRFVPDNSASHAFLSQVGQVKGPL